MSENKRGRGTVCSYRGCKNLFYSDKLKEETILFFRYPKDQELCNIWAENCGRSDLLRGGKSLVVLYNSYRVCNKHFAEIMYINGEKRRLLPLAVPDKYCGLTETCTNPVTSQELHQTITEEHFNEPSTSGGVKRSREYDPPYEAVPSNPKKKVNLLSDVCIVHTKGKSCNVQRTRWEPSESRDQSLLRIENKESYLEDLPYHHQKWLHLYKDHLSNFKKCIEKNSQLIPLVLEHAISIFDYSYCNGSSSQSEKDVGSLSNGLDKVQHVFKQLMRDWSSLGAQERLQSYGPIIDEILENYPDDIYKRSSINVLVPGAGLGRLAYEIFSKGFSCQGNEFSLYMLIASYFILNMCKKENEFEIYPWIHCYCNNIRAEDQMISAKFPDVVPMPTPDGRFSMTAGDFLEVYTAHNEWHCVATCFFIDCAKNVVQFIEIIYNILKPGGLWINLGPLLYHYSDMKNENSIEPSLNVLLEVIETAGFHLEKCQTGVKSKYCQNPESMLQYEYDSVFFVCRKPVKIDYPEDINVTDEYFDDFIEEQ